jgi:hypothetical protein
MRYVLGFSTTSPADALTMSILEVVVERLNLKMVCGVQTGDISKQTGLLQYLRYVLWHAFMDGASNPW